MASFSISNFINALTTWIHNSTTPRKPSILLVLQNDQQAEHDTVDDTTDSPAAKTFLGIVGSVFARP